jgi:broad specificity phosphatase PhoE
MSWRGGGLAWLGTVLFTEDATLTPLGQQQADAVRVRIASDKLEPLRSVDVVLCSPLSRTIETATRIFFAADHPRLVLSPLCAERCLATCDRGLRKPRLEQRWPHVCQWECFDALPDVWWPAKRSWLQEYAPVDRMHELKAMLLRRPESTIAVVGHAGIFACLTGRRLSNCQVLWCDLHTSAETGEVLLTPSSS